MQFVLLPFLTTVAFGLATGTSKRADCLSQQVQLCAQQQPSPGTSGQSTDAGSDSGPNAACFGADKKAEFAAKCDDVVRDFCSDFGVGRSVNPPEGCPGHTADTTATTKDNSGSVGSVTAPTMPDVFKSKSAKKADTASDSEDSVPTPPSKPKSTTTSKAKSSATDNSDDEEDSSPAKSTPKAKAKSADDSASSSSDKDSSSSDKTTDTASDNSTVDVDAATADYNSCNQMQATAMSCCANPETCGGTQQTDQQAQLDDIAAQASANGDTTSLRNVCDQAYQAGATGSNLTNDYASICSNKHDSCEITCRQLYTKWSGKLQSCTGSQCATLTDLVSRLDSRASSCNGLSAVEQALKDAALSTASNAGVANTCQQTAASDPDQAAAGLSSPSSVTPGAISGPPTESAAGAGSSLNSQAASPTALTPPPMGSAACGSASNISACMNCDAHPEWPSCGGSSSNPTAMASSNGPESTNEGSTSAGSSGAGKFNVAGAGSEPSQGSSLGSFTPPVTQSASAIPAGSSGGAIFPPLESQQTLSKAILSQARHLTSVSKSDVLSGERGGGGYSNPVGHSGFENLDPKSAMHAAHKKDEPNEIGLDLKKYLPGSRIHRALAGYDVLPGGVGPREIDMFMRVTGRIQTICANRRLVGCN